MVNFLPDEDMQTTFRYSNIESKPTFQQIADNRAQSHFLSLSENYQEKRLALFQH